MNLVRIGAIANNGFREVIRDRVLYLIGFFSLALALALQLLPEVSVSTEDKIFLDLGLAATALLGAIVAIFVGTNLINKEIEKRTVLVLIPKPLSSTELVLGKHLGLTAVLAVVVATMTAVFFLLLSFRQIPSSPWPLLVSQLYLLLELALLTAIAMVFGSFTSSILATLFSVAAYLVGHISTDLLNLGEISKNSTVETVTRVAYLVLPDLERLNLRNQVVYHQLPRALDLFSNAAYGLTYTAVLLALTIIIFSRREF